MKVSGVCPKCSSKRIVGPISSLARDHNIVFTRKNKGEYYSVVYACADCGFFEKYVGDRGIKELNKMFNEL